MSKREAVAFDFNFIKRYIGSIVEVHLVDGKTLKGRLTKFDPEYLNIILEEVETGKNYKVPAALISGSSVSYILFLGPPKLRIPKSKRKDLEKKVVELIKSNPNLDIETIARLCNARVDKVKEILAKLDKRHKFSEHNHS